MKNDKIYFYVVTLIYFINFTHVVLITINNFIDMILAIIIIHWVGHPPSRLFEVHFWALICHFLTYKIQIHYHFSLILQNVWIKYNYEQHAFS